MNKDRRAVLAVLGGVLAAPFSVAAAAGTPACPDPASLTPSQKSRRRSLGYTEPAPDEDRRCARCAFFSADNAGCGKCQLLSGGTVSPQGVCNSFAAKAG